MLYNARQATMKCSMRLLAILVLLTSACFVDVDHGNTQYSCVESKACPPGLSCISGKCLAPLADANTGMDSALDSASATDAAGADAQPSATITEVSAIDIVATKVRITWTVSENATGQTEYGPTQAYGQLSIKEESFTYATHIQGIAGLLPDTEYHYRVHSETMSGEMLVSEDFTFSTLAQ